MLLKQQTDLHASSLTYSKLKAYTTFKDFKCEPAYLSLSLSFLERKNLCKALMGILPVNEELLRYSRPIIPAEERFCEVCRDSQNMSCRPVENLEHCTFNCVSYNELRSVWLQKLKLPVNFSNMTTDQRFKIIFNEQQNIKPTAKFITSFLNMRSVIISKYN